MTSRKPKLKVEVLNPRYKGATPEMVARALTRPMRKEGKVKPVIGRGQPRSSI
ncbi:MAG: hypothetical protein OXD29_08800 [Roseovarius sp.]|nr:hypothetical protein [Roseovarius sp.]MCY4290414.1 hypothetical protein [Roseovarius sp.]